MDRRLLFGGLLAGYVWWVAGALAGSDPLTAGTTVVVPGPQVAPRAEVQANAQVPIDLSALAPEDDGDLVRSQAWYKASQLGGTLGLPLVEQPGQFVRFVPLSRRPWSSTYWPLTDCGLAFGETYAYPRPYRLSPLEAYDTYVYNQTGFAKNPRAAFFEAVTTSLGADPRTGWYYHNLTPLWLYGPPTSTFPDPREALRAKRAWYGHCNAWTQAAILEPEPPQRVVVRFSHPLRVLRLARRHAWEWTLADNGSPDAAYTIQELPTNEFVLTRADLAGILTEAHMAAAALETPPTGSHATVEAEYLRQILTSFRRGTGIAADGYNSGNHARRDSVRPGTLVPPDADVSVGLSNLTTDIRERWLDPTPHDFHLIMLANIAERRRAFAADVDANGQVDNHPIFGYAYKRNFVRERDRRYYLFHSRVRYATYYSDPSFPGTAAKDIDYHFRVDLDAHGRIIGSEWVGPSGNPIHRLAHPDQMWFPKAFAAGVGFGNRNLEDAVVHELIGLYRKDP